VARAQAEDLAAAAHLQLGEGDARAVDSRRRRPRALRYQLGKEALMSRMMWPHLGYPRQVGAMVEAQARHWALKEKATPRTEPTAAGSTNARATRSKRHSARLRQITKPR
jgi:hypothetical protein